MALRGFLTSCATPDINWPMAASLAVVSIWSLISARDPMSRRVTKATHALLADPDELGIHRHPGTGLARQVECLPLQ